MVCKEELFSWFKSLKGSKRLEVICGLLHMCCPLELRYCATCIEELASRDFFSLKEEESKANNPSEISKVKNILDPHTRSKLIVSLSLLHSANVLCSNTMFKAFVEELKIDALISAGVFSDAKCVDELLLLLTLAQNHPAFTFEQQSFLMDLFCAVENYAQQSTNEEDNSRTSLNSLIPTVNLISPVLISQDTHLCNNTAMCYHHNKYDAFAGRRNVDGSINQNMVTSLKAKAPHRKMSFRIRVAFGTSRMFDIWKTPYEIAVFHQKLIQLFPHESRLSNHDKYIPQLSHLVLNSDEQEVLTESITTCLTEYIEQLSCHLPNHVLQHEHVMNFLSLPIQRSNSRLRSLTIYNSNSHISDCSPTKQLDGRPRMVLPSPANQVPKRGSENGSVDAASVPSNAVIISPLASPYVSPTNSRSASPWVQRVVGEPNSAVIFSETCTLEKVLIKEHLHEYWENLRHYRIEDLQLMTLEELESLGVAKETCSRIKKLLEGFRPYIPNGLSMQRNQVSSVISNCLPIQDVSDESSPDYSSPSQSPSPTEICNHNSCNSSSSEETSTDKGAAFNDPKITDTNDRNLQDALSKRLNENLVFPKGARDISGRHSISPIVPFPVGYATAVPHISPMQGPKPSFLPIQCRTNTGGVHINSSGVVFEGPYSRLPLPSALTFIPHMSMQRSHSGTPERGLPSTPGMPITTLCPFPLATSGCSTAPVATSSFAGNRSGNITVVTNSVAPGNGRQFNKVVQPSIEAVEILPKPPMHQQSVENMYSPHCGYLISSGDASTRANASNCSCIYTATFAGRPSPSQSPSQPPVSATQQTMAPVTVPYVGPPYVFPHSFPFIQTHSGATANGFLQPATIAAAGHGFTYALPNGVSAISPEMYGAHAFTLQTPSHSQATPPLIASPVSQCYASFPQPVTVAGMAATHAVKVTTCYNCGKMGHRGSECKDQNIEEINKPGKFQMNFVIAAKPFDSNE